MRSMKKKIKIITSWDDGSQLDMTLAELLVKYKIPAVFYVPVKTRDLMDNQIRKLAGTEPNCDFCKKTRGLFEIGAHTLTHPEDLKKLPDEEAVKEIAGSKAGLETIIRSSIDRKYEVVKFAYPSGRFNDRVKEIVKNCGFKEARTTLSGSVEFPSDVFAVRPTVQVHPEKEYDGLSWKEFAEEKLDEVIEVGGRFELWGHSEEIEEYNMWEFLEDFLWYMDKRMKEINYPRKAKLSCYKLK